ncbi:MAG: exodeoxyribonuclease V subunit gamma [Deltaproteobacteria bacterium]|nr:MAG: exodeoxyribonuclease V subunit gamma [Deltaproteobacteria bacterium]
MASLCIHISNRLEILAEELAYLLRHRSSSPLQPSIVLIQSRGMERWLAMQIAHHNGICANIRFLFPNALIYELFGLVLDDIPEESFLDVELMKWRLMKILPVFMERESSSFLKRYLRKEKRDLSLFQLSSLIADTFDQYLIFRPDMIFRWEKGLDDHWQAELFRLLIKDTNGLHRARIARLFMERLDIKKEKLPEQIYLFGISAIPRFHMDIISAASRAIDAHLFLMNPCKEYWGDIIPERQIMRRGKASREELHLEKGNPLLSSLGRMGRDFFDIINEYEFIEDYRFQEIEETSLLSYIQSDILHLRDIEAMEKREIKEEDLSVQIHSCHSPMREVEVLYDRLLDMLENNPHLTPRDIIVMTPDIERYAPFIQAGFGAPDRDGRIPFSLADRSPRWENRVMSTFFKILGLRESRFEASRVLDILESEHVCPRFGISMDDVDLIRRWVRDAGIRWGIDKESRQKISGLSMDMGTWVEGIKSLVLGYALLDEDQGEFEGIFPYDRLEGREAELLGRFVDFLDRLFRYAKGFFSQKRLGEWQELLFDMIDDLFFVDEENQADIQLLRNIISEMAGMEALAGLQDELELDVLVWNMERQLDRRGYGSRFLTGGITFCAMLPMRSIPFKVICLIGMNYESFPRHSKRWEFDLIQRYPRKGDRSKRDDDKYLFLETILSARETLYISYTGQSIKDNSPIPPSVVVSELLDYIDQGFYIRSKDIIGHISFVHPLHPFNPVNFKGKRFFSYSENNRATAQAMISKRTLQGPFLRHLSHSENGQHELDIKEICDFFSHPCRFLLRRLGISLPRHEDIIEDVEIIKLKGLDRYRFEQDLLHHKLHRRERDKLVESMQARGLLPPGSIGEYEFKRAEQRIDLFVKRLEEHINGEKKELDLELFVDGFSIKGRIKEIYSNRLFFYRFGRIRPSDRIRIWLNYLLLVSYGLPLDEAMFMGLDENDRPFILSLMPMDAEKAKEMLKDMLGILGDGLQRPVHFFPESSWKYAESRYIKREERDKALQRARAEWEGSDYRIGEGRDAYFQFCFRGVNPVDEEFMELSERIFLPIILNSKREE